MSFFQFSEATFVNCIPLRCPSYITIAFSFVTGVAVL
jgi:hypothetical protein